MNILLYAINLPFNYARSIDTETAYFLSYAGQFGDSFGFANAVINALVMLVALYTLNIQRRETSRQANETSTGIKIQSMGIEISALAARLAAMTSDRDLLHQIEIHSHRLSGNSEFRPSDPLSELSRLRAMDLATLQTRIEELHTLQRG